MKTFISSAGGGGVYYTPPPDEGPARNLTPEEIERLAYFQACWDRCWILLPLLPRGWGIVVGDTFNIEYQGGTLEEVFNMAIEGEEHGR